MPSLDEIKSQIKGIGGLDSFLGRREIKELPNVIWHDERVENIVQGSYNNGLGILIATNKRLVFVDKGMFFGLKVEDFPYDKISSIQYETGLLLGSITIFTSGNKAVIDNVEKSKARSFGDWIRARISTAKENVLEQPKAKVPSSNSDVILEKLERLAKLKEQGILTEDEFQKQKQIILAE